MLQNCIGKRARDYNSEDESEQDNATPLGNNEDELIGGSSSGEEAEKGDDHSERNVDNGFSDDEEHGEILPGIMRFTRVAMRLGAGVVGAKETCCRGLLKKENERNVKGEAKKEKQLVIEKGHVKPANYLDSHEKFLIGVNKAQNAQKGLNPSKFKDAKVIKSGEKKPSFQSWAKRPPEAHTSKGPVDGEGPAWAPLQDNYMLTNSKLKDWDKMPNFLAQQLTGTANRHFYHHTWSKGWALGYNNGLDVVASTFVTIETSKPVSHRAG
ncbi:hypothetical protein Prudu_009711 [Prunus dulcis]|uniref:Uncharacterized protein n=1 Tax=Prunus dulcis TaxID=3755 RepID=A0A4Y1R6V4_PRUDU|nr:hypothetical protein Prudu_009711 [Prunus dulcis]